MKKFSYFFLLCLTISVTFYVAFFAHNKDLAEKTRLQQEAEALAAQEAKKAKQDEPGVKHLTTKTGILITVREKDPSEQTLSQIEITTSDASSTPIIVDKNKLTDVFLADLNEDGYDELVLVTTNQGNLGDISIYTTKTNPNLSPIIVPQITEEDTVSGGLFEGYRGYDSFVANNNKLTRTFPVYKLEDTVDNPTGGKRELYYILEEKNGTFLLTLKNTTEAAN